MPIFQSLNADHAPRAADVRPGIACPARLGAMTLISPAIAQSTSPLLVDNTLLLVLLSLCILGGLGVGFIYRSLQQNEERLNRRLAQAQAELRTLLTMTEEAVLVLDESGIIRNANPGAEELFDCTNETLIGQDFGKHLPQLASLEDLTKNGPAQFRATARRIGSESSAVEVAISQVHHSEEPSYLVMLHPLPQSGHGFVEARMAELKEPAGRFFHDLNNRLTGIIGNLSLILMTGTPDATTRDRVAEAKRTALHAQELSRSMHSLMDEESIHDDRVSPRVLCPVTAIPSLATPASTTRNKRVLVLDDEAAICALVSTALDSMGFEVTEANDVPSAIRACEDAVKDGRPFGVVISDLSLEGDVNGSDAVARLKSIDPSLKAIVSSGYDTDPIMNHYREHGFCGAIAKPYEISMLGKVVREAIADEDERKSA